MLIKRMKKIFYWLVVISTIFLVFENISIRKTHAFRRNAILYHLTDTMDAREVAIYDNVYYVYTNQIEKFILVRGTVSDWKEEEKVEEYFISRSPFGYQLIFDIDSTQ